MLKTIIFDLSEVLIAGMYGIEKPLAQILNIPEDTIIPLMSGDLLQQLFRGEITEEHYLKELLARERWNIAPEILKRLIRNNFHRTVPGMNIALLRRLTSKYKLILFSDHAREWIEYLQPIHQSLLSEFQQLLFSFNPRLRGTKKEITTIKKALRIIGNEPEECLMVDDKKGNIKRAAEVGIPGILFTDAQYLTNVQFPQHGIILSQ